MFVCQHDYAKTTRPIFTKFDGKVTHGPQKKSIDFDLIRFTFYVTVKVRVELGLRSGGGTAILRVRGCVTAVCFLRNNFVVSAALAEVCALLSAMLVVYKCWHVLLFWFLLRHLGRVMRRLLPVLYMYVCLSAFSRITRKIANAFG